MEVENMQDGGKGKFEVRDGEQVMGVLEYDMPSPNVLRALHTETKEGFEGKGVGTALFNGMIEHAQEHNLKIDPQCEFIKGKMGTNEATKQLIAKEGDQ